MSLKKNHKQKNKPKQKHKPKTLLAGVKTGSFEFPRGRIAFCETVYVKQSGFKKKTTNKTQLFFNIVLKQAHSKLANHMKFVNQLNLKIMISSVYIL